MRLLRQNKITGWRRHFPVPGRPDFAFPRSKVALFIDGCFWHGCSRCNRTPHSSRAFWQGKIERNKKRDASVSRQLRKNGWKVARIKECELKQPERVSARILALF